MGNSQQVLIFSVKVFEVHMLDQREVVLDDLDGVCSAFCKLPYVWAKLQIARINRVERGISLVAGSTQVPVC
jgi:hypothetical protein